MTSGGLGASRGDVLRIFEGESVAGLGDGELLGRFAERGEAAAFEALVARLGPMVLGTCRRMLADSHDVDDAFQATFLVLVRRAGSIRDRDLVGAWLHGVATKISRRARAQARSRAARERLAVVAEAQEAEAGLGSEWPELRALIDEEIELLPEHHRRPVLLCDVEGLSREEAALRLGWTLNMVRGRLERARDRLRGRLARRGLAPSGAWAALVVSPPTLSPALLASTTRVALSFAVARLGTGLASASAVALSQGVLRMMMLSKLKLGLALLLSTGFVAAGSGMIAAQAPGDKPAAKADVALVPPQVDFEKRAVVPAEIADPFKPRSAADLAKARIEMALQRFKVQKAFYDEGRITTDRVMDASIGLMEAECDAAGTKAARVEAVRSHYSRVLDCLRREEAELAAGRATDADVTEMKTALLDAEFALAKELELPEMKSAGADVKAGSRPPLSGPVADLAKARVEMATLRFRMQNDLYNNAGITTDRVLDSSRTLLEAERDSARTKAGRVEAIRAHQARLQDILKIAKLMVEAARTTQAELAEVKTAILDAEFALVKEIESPETKTAGADAKVGSSPAVEGKPADSMVIDRILKERIESARQVLAEASRMFPGEIEVVDFLEASRESMQAELDAATSSAGRLAVIGSQVNRLRDAQQQIEGLINQGLKKQTDRQKVRVQLLQAELMLSKEGTGSGPQSGADLERRVSEVERKVDRLLNLLDSLDGRPKR